MSSVETRGNEPAEIAEEEAGMVAYARASIMSSARLTRWILFLMIVAAFGITAAGISPAFLIPPAFVFASIGALFKDSVGKRQKILDEYIMEIAGRPSTTRFAAWRLLILG